MSTVIEALLTSLLADAGGDHPSATYPEIVTPEQFGTVGTGDDTIALDGAFSSGKIVDLGARDWVYQAASHIGDPVVVSGPVIGSGFKLFVDAGVQLGLSDGFDLSGGTIYSSDVFDVDQTVARSANPSSVWLFSNRTGGVTRPVSKGRFALNCHYLVSADDGTSKGEGFVEVAGSEAADIAWDTDMSGAILSTYLLPHGGSHSGRAHFKNCETCFYSRSGPIFDLDLKLINTPTQQKNFRPTGGAGAVNGKDLILVEYSGVKTPSTRLKLHTEYAVERGGYIQGVKNGMIDSWSIGCDGGKTTAGCENLVIHSHTTLTPNGNAHQRYSWANYGTPAAGPNANIVTYPYLDNQTGVPGNKEVAPHSGGIRNCKVIDPYGYNCGWGVWLIQGVYETFGVDIDGLSILGGRMEGPGGKTPTNGALQGFNSNEITAPYSASNVRVLGASSMPSASGPTFALRGITGVADLIGCEIDGVTEPSSYSEHVITEDCPNGRVEAWQLKINSPDTLSFDYVTPFLRTDLAVNTTQKIAVGVIAPELKTPFVAEIEVIAAHSSQPQRNYIAQKWRIVVLPFSSEYTVSDVYSSVHASQGMTLVYDNETRQIEIDHISTTPLGFDEATFTSRMRANAPVTT